MTRLCLPLLRDFLMAVTFLRLYTYSAMTRLFVLVPVYVGYVWRLFHVYKRPILRLRNSKRVLLCTNTSRRRTCPNPHLVNPDPRELPYFELSKS